MKNLNLALVIVTATFASCSTIYKNAQTPDDVYFSPAKNLDEYVRVESEREKYNYSDNYYDDRYLRMKVNNRIQWNDLDDWFAYDRYSYRYNYFYGTYYNPYTTWNYYYNPYSQNNIIVVNPHISTSTANVVKPKPFSIAAYNNSNYNYNNSNRFSNSVNVVRTKYNNSNNNYSGGQNNSNYSPTASQPSRTYSPPPSSNSGSSSSGSSSSSSSAEVSRPNRGGN